MKNALLYNFILFFSSQHEKLKNIVIRNCLKKSKESRNRFKKQTLQHFTHFSIIYVGTICMKLIQPGQAKGGSRQNKPSERLSDKVRDNVEF